MTKYTIEQLETMFAKNRANLSKTRVDQNRGLFLNRLVTLSSIAFGAGLLFMGIWALDFAECFLSASARLSTGISRKYGRWYRWPY